MACPASFGEIAARRRAPAIGMTAGLGREVTAVLGTLLALGVFSLIPHFQPNGTKK